MMFSSHRLKPPLYPEAAPMAPQKVKPARAEEERDGPLQRAYGRASLARR